MVVVEVLTDGSFFVQLNNMVHESWWMMMNDDSRKVVFVHWIFVKEHLIARTVAKGAGWKQQKHPQSNRC